MDTPIPANTFNYYPSLLRRFQSNFIDRIITYTLISVFYACSMHIDSESWTLKIISILLALSYEPFMVAFLSRTVGQVVVGIRVKSLSMGQRISLLNAYTRFVLQFILGWVSFLSIHTNDEHRALHDIASNTVVVRA